MSWINDNLQLLIAEKDIIVYKYGFKENDIFISRFTNYLYIKNKHNPEIKLEAKYEQPDTLLGNKFEPFHYIILNGYHSYLKLENMKDELYNSQDPRIDEIVLAKFIIPKNSEYYINTNNQIVSNNIIFKDFI